MEVDSKQQTFVNDAFISYSRKDREFAVRLEKVLRNYKPPKGLNLPQRNLVVFRDEEDFTGVEYHASMEKHLKNSRKMIAICSPHARKSGFVNDEIRRFAQERGKENIIPVLISGIPNNEVKPEQEEEKAFPEALCELMKQPMEMPLAASYIGFGPKKDKVNKGVFYGAWYKILADLYDISRNEIEERDKKRKARQRNILIGAASAVFLIVTSLAVYAWVQKTEAERRMRIAQAQQLAVNSNSFRESLPERSLLLAVASIIRTSKLDRIIITSAEEALRDSLSVTAGMPLRGHEGDVAFVAFSPDGKRLASASERKDGTVRIWDLGDPQADPVIMRGHNGMGSHVAFSPDWKRLASGGKDGALWIWDLGDPKSDPVVLEANDDMEYVTSVAFSPDGTRLASGRADGTVRIWEITDLKAGTLILRGHKSWVSSVAFSPNGKKLASGGEDGAVRIWDLWEPKSGPAVMRGHENGVTSVAFSSDGKRLASGDGDGTVRIWEIADLKAGASILRGHKSRVSCVVFSPDGKRLASGGSDKTIRLWNVDDPKAGPGVLRGHEEVVESVAFSPDGKRLASGGGDGTVRLWDPWDTKAGPVLMRDIEHGVKSVAFSPDGKLFASGSSDETVRVWDMEIDTLLIRACQTAGRNLTCEEWQQFLTDEPYSPICPDLPYPKDCGKKAKAE